MSNMLTGRLERGYNNNAPTHTAGFQIDYPPPPPPALQQANPASVSRAPNFRPPTQKPGPGGSAPLGKEVPPPLPPKVFIGQNLNPHPHAQMLPKLCNPLIIAPPAIAMMPHGGKAPNNANNTRPSMPMISRSGFVMSQGLLAEVVEGRGGDNGKGGIKEEGKVVRGTWSGGLDLTPIDFKASSLLDSHDRFKPEKSQRRLVQRMKWSQSRWGRSLAGDLFSYSMGPPTPLGSSLSPNGNEAILNNHPAYYGHLSLPPLPVESESRVSSMTIADISPRLAVKKVLLLYEHQQYREAAMFINRLSVGTFRIILRELPMDVFVEAMPHSLPIIEALYCKIYSAEGPQVDLHLLKPDALVMHMVKFFSREDSNQQGPQQQKPKSACASPPIPSFTSGCVKILRVIIQSDPTVSKKLKERAKSLDKIIEGMGQHGLVGTTDESLTPLHDALKLEFQRVVETYKGALQKLEDLSLSNKNTKSVAKGPAPVSASHQRQLSLRASDIQQRLIKNKSVLNAVEPTFDNNCLDILLGILQRRVEVDKDALFQFTQLRKETGDVANADCAIVAAFLMRYARGCRQVLSLVRQVGKEVGAFEHDDEDEEDSSELSGYHSDSDSAIMTSGNSPFVTPRARYNFLSRSVRSKQGFRPSLLLHPANNPWSSRGNLRQIIGKVPKSLSGSSFDSSSLRGGGSSPEEVGGRSPNSSSSVNGNIAVAVGTGAPIRPRHVKNKSWICKNHSLVSTTSTQSDSSTSSGCGASLTSGNSFDYTANPNPNPDLQNTSERPEEGSKCIECITVVSVPDSHIITQGKNHHCIHKENSTLTQGEVLSLRAEIAKLKRELQSAYGSIYHLQEKEKDDCSGGGLLKKVQTEESVEAAKTISQAGKQPQERKAELAREYGALYAQARVETMDALDSLQELSEADELKSKLLFSVVVLAFRSVQTRLAEIKTQVSNLLQIENKEGGGTGNLKDSECNLVEALSDYLLSSQEKFDKSRCVEHVANQLWTTLYDYPCLRKCDGLLKYIAKCVGLAWKLANQTPPCILEYETRPFNRSMHVRFHSSDQGSDNIKTYLWPALIESGSGGCVHKGVVIT